MMTLRMEWKKQAFAYNLKFLRHEMGLTQQEVAEKSKLSQRSYQMLESGRGNPTLESMVLLAQTFKVHTSRLLQLSTLRLSDETPDRFLERLKEFFENHRLVVSLRNLDGKIIWMNKACQEASGRDWTKSPSLFDNLKEDPQIAAIVAAQLNCERRGFAQAYTLPYQDPRTHELEFYRLYPTLVFEHSKKAPIWTCTFATPITKDLDEDHFEFCAGLLKCCYGD